MTGRIPNAVKLYSGRIVGYAICFDKWSTDGSAKANIRYTGGNKDEVWGVVFQMSNTDLYALDKYEPNYNRLRLHVHTDSGLGVMAYAYQAIPEAIKEGKQPYDWYLKLIVEGARENQLPESYCEMLQATGSVIDSDECRSRIGTELLEG